MAFVLAARDGPSRQQRWRQQVASQLRRRRSQGARPVAAISYLIRGPVWSGLIDVRHLLFTVLHDAPRNHGLLAIRFAAYSTTCVPWGVRIGGAEACRFEKDLSLGPKPLARGRHFNSFDGELLATAHRPRSPFGAAQPLPAFPATSTAALADALGGFPTRAGQSDQLRRPRI